jgi:hypothetical protein
MELAKYLDLRDTLVYGRGNVVVEFNGRTASTLDELNFIAAAERLSITREEADAHSLVFGDFEAAIVREPEVQTTPPVPVVVAGYDPAVGHDVTVTVSVPVDDAPVADVATAADDVPATDDAPVAPPAADVAPDKPKKGK